MIKNAMEDDYSLAQIERMLKFIGDEYKEHTIVCSTCRFTAACCETGYAIMEQHVKWLMRHIKAVNQEVK